MKFFLHPHVFLVHGYNNGVLYDLKKGGIFSINSKSKQILSYVEEKEILLEKTEDSSIQAIYDYLKTLEELDLGYFCENKEKAPEKIKIEPKKTTLNQMWLSLNSNCNLTCIHCYATSQPGPCDDFVPLNRIFEIMQEAYEVFELKCVQLIGGEPLLLGKDKVTKIVKKASEIGIPTIEIFTNGHAINDYYIQLFKEENVRVAISIYSDLAEEHDAITELQGSWKKTVQAIKRLTSQNIPVRCGITAMNVNQFSVERVAPWLEEQFGIPNNGRLYDVVRFCGRGSNTNIIPWDMFKKQHMLLKPDFPPVSIELFRKTMYNNTCWGDKICILPNGNVTPCEMESENIQGNITYQNLSEIILGKGGDQAQRLTKDKVEICKDCEYRYVCSECRAMANQLDINKFSKPLTCLYNPYTSEWEKSPSPALIKHFPKLTGDLNQQFPLIKKTC